MPEEEEKKNLTESSNIYAAMKLKVKNKYIYESKVYFKFGPDQVEQYYMTLKGTDLYCYDGEEKANIKFMHTLIGCFIIINDSPTSANEEMAGKIYRRIELKLSQQFKRVFYVDNEKDYRSWSKYLKRQIG